MNDQLNQNNNHEEVIDKVLHSLSNEIDARADFKSELEGRLASVHQARSGSSLSFFKQALPMLGWTMGLVVLALFLNWVIRGIVPTPPVPAAGLTITPTMEITVTPPSVEDAGTPSPKDGYDWRGAKLYLARSLPESPATANVYQLKRDEQITPEEARGFARRFGLPEEMYVSYDYVFNVTDYYFTDGKQALEIYSNRKFNYIADLAKYRTLVSLKPIGEVEPIIREFLGAHGFDFPVKITPTDFFGGYSVEPLAPDGISIQYESFTFPPMLVKLDENGEVLMIDATLVDFDSTPLGTYGIISAQEALDLLRNDNEQGSKVDFFSSSHQRPQEWFRSYPDNQIITIYGYVSSHLPVDMNKSPFITIDGVPAIGNTAGLEQLDRSTFIQATGQYLIENGLRQFNVETWNTNIVEDYFEGTLRLEGDQIILTNKDGSDREYPLIDPPADLPLNKNNPDSQLAVSGIISNGKMDWTYIQFFEHAAEMGGGGGGGGLGFYQLNLSGTPIPFPTPTPQPGMEQRSVEYTVKEGDTVLGIAETYGIAPEKILQANPSLDGGVLEPGKTLIIPAERTAGQYTVQENDTLAAIALNHGVTVEQLVEANGLPDPDQIYVGQVLIIPGLENSNEQQVENLRGFLSISIHKKADGSELPSYIFHVSDSSTDTYYELEGSNLSELDQYNGLPMVVSGTIRNKAFIATLSLDNYSMPFPNLRFQVIKGTQRVQEIDGQIATLFTTENGTTYVEFQTSTDQLNFSIIGREGDLIQQEVLIVPDETFATYPVIRVFSAGMAISPKNGQPMDLPITADQIPVYDDTANPEIPNTTLPSLTIESIELEYFVNNPYYQVNDPNYERRSTYIQPVWHFQGRYENGATFDMMVQALKRDFLSPQLSPGISPG